MVCWIMHILLGRIMTLVFLSRHVAGLTPPEGHRFVYLYVRVTTYSLHSMVVTITSLANVIIGT